MSDDKIDRNDIRDQIAGIGEGVTHQAEEAKTQIVAVVAGIGLLALILFFFLGVTPKDQDPSKAAMNHSPLFYADESALPIGVKVMTNLALDYLYGGK